MRAAAGRGRLVDEVVSLHRLLRDDPDGSLEDVSLAGRHAQGLGRRSDDGLSARDAVPRDRDLQRAQD
jgi:hypothetical protein